MSTAGYAALRAEDDEPHRRAERGPAAEADEPQRAEEDLLIERADLGEGCATLVAAGDPIPAHLAHLPRRPRAPKPKGGKR